MRFYGIRTPEKEDDPSVLWWIATSQHGAWMDFFSRSDHNGSGAYHKVPLAEAIRAYQAIGYQCVELVVSVKEVCE